MSAKRYPEEFKLAAVRQITEGGYTVSDVARRLDVTADSLYAWSRNMDQMLRPIKLKTQSKRS